MQQERYRQVMTARSIPVHLALAQRRLSDIAWTLLALLPLLNIPHTFAAEPTQGIRSRLQFFNASTHAASIFWLQSASQRVPKGSINPGDDIVIQTTVGHEFAVVSQHDQTTQTTTAKLPVQAFVFLPGAEAQPSTTTPSTNPDHPILPPPTWLKAPAFYTQFVSAQGFPIVASRQVNPYALKEAAVWVERMLAARTDLRDAMVQSGSRLCIIGWNEFTTDLPEFTHLGKGQSHEHPDVSAKDFWDARARGTGGSETDPYVSCAEENVLGYPGDPYETECILIHEFAHSIHLRGLINVDTSFDPRLRSAYQAAMKAGLWKGKYASVNHHEYFAEGVQSWFDNNRENDHDHNHVNTRAELLEYDPGLAALCREVFGDESLRYTKPATRLTGHMVGYDPTKAPRFVWPERLTATKNKIRAAAKARDVNANVSPAPAPARETREILGWKVHIHRDLLAKDPTLTARAVELLTAQLDSIARTVPQAAVAHLRRVPLYLSPEYPNTGPRAEYHPGAQWLQDHGRDPAMTRAVEFTNIRIFDQEVRRMPVFVLHELAHAYHHQVLGNHHPEIQAAYAAAKASGSYDRVERQDAEGRRRFDRAYALTDAQEYFAEATEAFFGQNDFFPFHREELKTHDPTLFALLEKLWNHPPQPQP